MEFIFVYASVSCETKISLAAYGTDGAIPVLTASQLDTANKVTNILAPIEKITQNISVEAASISQVIPLIRALTKVLEKEDQDTGICTMKNKMLESRFDDIEEKEFLVLATMLDPRYKDKFFSTPSSHQFTRDSLMTEHSYVLEECELEEPQAKRAAIEEDEGIGARNKRCLSEILSENIHLQAANMGSSNKETT